MKEPLVSIIMPAYNAEKYIKKAIESVQKQDYQNWELLICDDCSVDLTKEIIKNYISGDKRIKLIELSVNSGAAVARNTSIKEANGRFIAFLDSDDLWLPEKLNNQISFMLKNNYNFTCTFYEKIDEEGNSLNKVIKSKTTTDFKELLKNCPGNSTVIYDSKIIGKFYIPDIKKRNDYLMWFNVLEKVNKLYCLEKNLSAHRLTESGLSKNKKSLLKYHWIIYRHELGLSYMKSTYYCLYWVSKGMRNLISN